ncbi:MAG: hypothetical protein P8Q35_01345 [Candidatus Thalassarchaeaceae archaeon]|nr:hypothetical protein [Candidatus Thalassarchaeaceae archaeon]
MIHPWLIQAAKEYNAESLKNKDSYAAVLLIPVENLDTIIDWTFKSLPDEILVGMDPNHQYPNPNEVEEKYSGVQREVNLFEGQGYVLGEPHLVNRGDSFEVHHVPEEWVDEFFSDERGLRGGRFTHWLHTHPNAPALPSEADADASQWTDGTDMILGIRFFPEGFLPWFEDIGGVRRSLTDLDGTGAIGRARTGHLIRGLEIICYHRSGLGVNLVITNNEGLAIE